MREIFAEIFENQPLDPMESARRAMRPQLRKRFYKDVSINGDAESGFSVLLDGKPIRTPLRRPLSIPTRALAERVMQEWNNQTDVIDPARMPITRLANAVIDAVVDRPGPVVDEIIKYLGSDLLFYRAGTPEGLILQQTLMWDPLLTWAHEELGARFVQIQGIVFVPQSGEAISAARVVIPANANDVKEMWRLGALSSITTLTGSAVLALALAHGAIDADAAWAAAHVDEDWQMSQWGRDELALERRAYRFTEFEAAVTVLQLTR